MDVTALLQPNLRPTISQLDLEQSGQAFVLHEQQMEIQRTNGCETRPTSRGEESGSPESLRRGRVHQF